MLKTIAFKQARHYYKGRVKPIQLIVLHSAEAKELPTTAEAIANYFATTDREASAHFCVDNNSITQSVKIADTAWHCKNANANGIGIEHAGYAKQSRQEWLDPYGIAMLDLSAQLVAHLCRICTIPVQVAQFAGESNPAVTARGITRHLDVPKHGTHYDVGKSFPYEWYLEKVKYYYDNESLNSLTGVTLA